MIQSQAQLNNSKKFTIDLDRFQRLAKEIGELTRQEQEGIFTDQRDSTGNDNKHR